MATLVFGFLLTKRFSIVTSRASLSLDRCADRLPLVKRVIRCKNEEIEPIVLGLGDWGVQDVSPMHSHDPDPHALSQGQRPGLLHVVLASFARIGEPITPSGRDRSGPTKKGLPPGRSRRTGGADHRHRAAGASDRDTHRE